MGDEIADRLLNLFRREGIAEPEGIAPCPAIAFQQRIAFVDRERLQAHDVARQLLREVDQLIAQGRREEDENEDDDEDEHAEDQQRRDQSA